MKIVLRMSTLALFTITLAACAQITGDRMGDQSPAASPRTVSSGDQEAEFGGPNNPSVRSPLGGFTSQQAIGLGASAGAGAAPWPATK